ncbi:WD40-repeat-containing domain protein [Chytridium lagenaria]|nr:WD40-repeat-containing domain protein [Chytridium lagenaria]
MEQLVQSLKDEQTELYKTQGQNAQRLLDMVETIKTQEQGIKKQTDEIQRLTSSLSSLTVKWKDAVELIKEKDGVIQILKDELATHQLELVQREEQLKESEDKVKKLEAENRQIVERWILLKQEEAQKMNECAQNQAIFSANVIKNLTPEISRKVRSDVRCTLPNVIVKRSPMHESDINCIQISRDGNLIATGSNDKKLILTDAKTGNVRTSLIGSLQALVSTSFSHDGELVLGTSNDHSTKIWSISTSRLKHTLTGHIGKVFAAKFTNTNRVISGSHDRTLKVWDLARGYCTQTIFTLSSCNDLELLDGEGTQIVSGHLDNNLRVWDTRTGNLVREVTGIHSNQITGVTLSPSENQILTTSRDNTLRLIDTRMFEVVSTYSHESFRVLMNWTKSCFSPDANYICCGSVDGSVFIWNADTGKTERILREHRSSVCGVVWNPQGGSHVYSAEKDRAVLMWGVA